MPEARTRLVGALILLGAAAWSGYALLADSPVVDESPHLAAGISYVELLSYRLNPEHPPLIKAAAGLAASVADPVLPTDAAWWPDGINEQWRAGDAVLWDGHNHAGVVLGLGRLGVALLCFALVAFGWRALAARWGERWALAFLALTAASPFFLGHAHLVTTDVAAAGTAAVALAAFARYLERPGRRAFALATLAFGIAQLAKFSLILLVPTFAIAAAIAFARPRTRDWRALGRGAARGLAVCAAGYALVVYPAYLALTWNDTPAVSRRDAAFLLSSFAGGPSDRVLRSPMRYAADAAIALSGNKVTQPLGTYGLGVLMVVQRSAGGNTAYFAGQVGSSGSRLYFPLVYAAKETLPALAIVIGGIALAAWSARKRGADRDAILMLVTGTFAALYLASTLRSSLNIGIRHLFPVIPLLYLFALAGWRRAADGDRRYGYALAILVLLHVCAGILSLPYPLAAYNALAGGTKEGYLVAADSNYDWGQDALRLRSWIDANPEAGTVAVNVFGGSDAQALLGPRAIAWWSARGNPEAYGIRWIAISSSYLLTATQPLVPLEPRRSIDEYRWLQELKGVPYGAIPEPDARAGTSIFLYRLD